jgi:hypothetical protein
MNERPAPAEADARRWACTTLGVAEDATADEVRVTFLKQVGEADFFPAPDSVIAWQALVGAAAANPRTACIVAEKSNDLLRESVESFAGQFFDIAVHERVQQWFDLNARCQSSAALVARLDALSAGLHIDRQAALANTTPATGPETETAASERDLAKTILELFLLRPVDRAERQQELLSAWQADLKKWQNAARKFKKQQPKIAALDVDFIDILLAISKPARHVAAAMKAPAPAAKPAAAVSRRLWPRSIGVFLVLMVISAVSRFAREGERPAPSIRTPQNNNDLSNQRRAAEERARQLRAQPGSDPNLSPLQRSVEEMPAMRAWRKEQQEQREQLEELERAKARLRREVDAGRIRGLPDRVSPHAPPPAETETPAPDSESESPPEESP